MSSAISTPATVARVATAKVDVIAKVNKEEAGYELAATEYLLPCQLSMTHPAEQVKWRAFVDEMETDR